MKVINAACKALFIMLTTATALAAAQSYPNKPVRFLVGFALNSPDLRERLTSQGADPVPRTLEEYTAFVQSEIAKWAKVIKAAGIKGE